MSVSAICWRKIITPEINSERITDGHEMELKKLSIIFSLKKDEKLRVGIIPSGLKPLNPWDLLGTFEARIKATHHQKEIILQLNHSALSNPFRLNVINRFLDRLRPNTDKLSLFEPNFVLFSILFKEKYITGFVIRKFGGKLGQITFAAPYLLSSWGKGAACNSDSHQWLTPQTVLSQLSEKKVLQSQRQLQFHIPETIQSRACAEGVSEIRRLWNPETKVYREKLTQKFELVRSKAFEMFELEWF